MSEQKYTCEGCANARSPLCELCARIHSPSGRERRPSFFVSADTITKDAARDSLIALRLSSADEDPALKLSTLLLECVSRRVPMPLSAVLEYNRIVEPSEVSSYDAQK